MPELEDTSVETPSIETPSEPVVAEPRNASEAFDAIAAEAKAELEARDKVETPVDEDEDEKPSDTDEDEEEEADEDEKPDTSTDDDESDEEDEEKPSDSVDDDEEAEETDSTQQILELLRNPETLEAALRQAGVETIQELPIVKDIIGRERQSVADQTKNDFARAEWEARNIEGVMTEGRAAQNTLIETIEKLSKDLEEGAEDFDVPTGELITEAFEKFGKGAMQAYHNAHFSAITDRVYQYPEYQNLSPQQQADLAAFDGAPPADWLDKHLEIGRENLWRMAQEDVSNQARQYVADQTRILTEAHKAEVEKLQTKHEKRLEKAIAKATEETRAAALAEFATKGTAPKTPKKEGAVSVDDEEVDYTSFETIAASVKRSLERTSGGV